MGERLEKSGLYLTIRLKIGKRSTVGIHLECSMGLNGPHCVEICSLHQCPPKRYFASNGVRANNRA